MQSTRRVLALLLIVAIVGCAPGTDEQPPPASSLPSLPPASLSPTTTESQPEADERFHVAPDGSDDASGTVRSPWKTLSHALEQLEAGDTLIVHDGTYPERVRVVATPGTAREPVQVRAADGAEPVIVGLLWLHHPDHWVIDGLNVTWDPDRNDSGEHMVKITDGSGWTLQNSELWGAESYAALLVFGTEGGESSDWLVSGNCIHDTVPSNDRNEDQLVYVNTGWQDTNGLIANNVLFGAENGSAVKLGGPGEGEGGAHGVTVRNNTILDTAQGVFIAWEASENRVVDNLFAGTEEGYGHIRGYKLWGEDNVVAGNGGDEHRPFILNDEGYTGVVDGGDNVVNAAAEVPEPSCDFLVDLGYGLESALATMPSS